MSLNKSDSVLREILIIAVGEALCTALMLGIFALAEAWSLKVLWGGLLGCCLAISNYGLMALGVAIATRKATEQDVRGGQRAIQLSMLLRLVFLALVLFIALKRKLVNPIALVVPLFLFRPILSAGELFRKSGDKKNGS